MTNLLSGAGNTFHIVWQNPVIEKNLQKNLVMKICKTYPADGFIFLNPLNIEKSSYQWDFYNNDGSAAEMCGNATRCVGYYIKHQLQSSANTFHLQTVAGIIEITCVDDEKYKIQMTEIKELKNAEYFFCDTGVPHIIIDFFDFKNYKLHLNFCKNLRFHSDFQPDGTNVTLISKTNDPQKLLAVSYERGVENFTSACGTGAMAAAFYNYKKYGQITTTVEMPGGELTLNLTNLKKPIMIGPAVLLGDYEYDNQI